MKKPAIFLSLILSISGLNIHAQKLQNLNYGKFKVGFQSNLVIDFSRPSREKPMMGRNIQINIWYPARIKSETAVRIRNYIELEGQEDRKGISKRQNDSTYLEFLSNLIIGGADSLEVHSFFKKDFKTIAFHNASILNNEYPVVLLMHGSAFQYMLMGQFLASNGFIAINTPYKGYLQNQFDVSILGMETEIRDIEFALSSMIQKMNLTVKNIGLVGYSFGGQSAVGLVVRNPLVKGIVSLDGGIGSDFGPKLLERFPFFKMDKILQPVMHLYNPHDKGGNIKWFDQAIFNNNYLIALDNMEHGFFGSFGWLDRYIPHVFGKNFNRVGNNPEIILKASLTFLEHCFKTDFIQSFNLKSINWMNRNIILEDFRAKSNG